MEFTALILGLALVGMFVFALLLSKQAKRLHNLSPADDALPGAASTCEGCKYFSLEGGQALMQANPAFVAASQVLPPWQMGQPRKVEPNAAYDDLEARMTAAGEAHKYELQAELHEELLKIRPGKLLPPEDYIGADVLKIQWTDFGACGRHSELRSKGDTCNERSPK